MRYSFLVATILWLSLNACQQEENFHGLWQEPICRSNPCLPKMKIHLGQYGSAVAGVISWSRTRPSIDTFNTPSYECGCDYIQAGSVDAETLTLTTYPIRNCEEMPQCNPCGCDNYDLTLTTTDDDRLIGNVICEDGIQHPVEFIRALGTPKDSCQHDEP